MSKAAKVWLIIAGSLVPVGCILFACVTATLGWDFSKLSDSGFETSTGVINVKNAAVGSLKLRASAGRVTVSGVKCAGDAGVETAAGKAELTDVSCNSFFSNGTTGDPVLKNLIAAGGFSAGRTTGNVKFDGCDTAELYVKIGTGDVTGSLLSEKVFISDTDTGSRDVPKTASGGRCEVITGTGDIHLRIKNR